MGSPMIKPRIRVKAGTTAFPAGAPARPATARWLRDSGSGVLTSRAASLVDSRDEIRAVWDRVAALAVDFIQNSGRLKGVVDQVLADTVGTELKLVARPDLTGLGYDDADTKAWAKLVQTRWRQWAWNPAECDLRGKFNVPQLVDIALRHQIAYGEATAMVDYMAPRARQRNGIISGVKVCLITPTRLVRDTDPTIRMRDGIIHDEVGRPIRYRIGESDNGLVGFNRTRDFNARDRFGNQLFIHAFDPWDANDTRGISVLAAALRTHAHSEQLADATLTTAILQTVFAATLTSPEPSAEAFQAIEELDGWDENPGAIKEDFLGYFGAAMDRAREGAVSINGSKVSHLAPGEKLEMHGVKTPGNNYLPFRDYLDGEMARCIGVTKAALTLDFDGATYSSTRMENASMWPIVVRRRERIAAPINQAIYENWLDGEIGEGRIPFKGGYAAFRANRSRVCWAEWQGPAKPTADDLKSAKAASERLWNGTSTLASECAELGFDVDDVIAAREADTKRLEAAGLQSPYVRTTGGGSAADAEDPAPTKKAAANAD